MSFPWRPLKRFCRVSSEYGLNVTTDTYRSDGVRLIRTTDVNEDGTLTDDTSAVFVDPEVAAGLLLVPDDLLFSRSGTLGRCLRYQGPRDACTFAAYLVRFQVLPEVDSRFVAYCAHARFFAEHVAAEAIQSTISNFNAEKYAQLRLPYPKPHLQTAIADYLDTETARIDALIEKKRRIIECLDERWAVYVRDRLLSCGAPDLPLKRTWTVTDCKHRTPDYVDSGYPVVSPGDATPGRLDLSRAHRFVDDDDLCDLTESGRRPKRGDIIYSRNASIGIASYVDIDAPFCMGQDVCLISSEAADQLYLTYVLNTLGADQLDVQKIGSTFSRINISQIVELSVPTPPLEEQQLIGHELDQRTLLRDRAVNGLSAQIDLLVERRQALITAAVTGQLDIPGVAA